MTIARLRPARVRQDLNTVSDFERKMNDRCASEHYEQLWLGALRAGTDPNLPDPVVVVEGYAPATFDPKWGAAVAAEERARLSNLAAQRSEMLQILRNQKEHKAKGPFHRALAETEYWMGVKEWVSSSSSSSSKTASHRHLKQTGGSQHEEDLTDDTLHITETPSYIRGKLRDYQVEGVNWLLGLFSRGINGILADEMGLGKTFQTIATLSYLKFTHGLPGPHLVVCPKSVLGNWYREFRMWCPSLNVYKFHAPGAARPSLVRAHLTPVHHLKYDVIITTFEMVLEELSHFKRIGWQYLIVDEAHKLKNEESRAHNALASLQTNLRLIITGTPLQNNLRELWALLHFLAPSLFDDGKSFEEWFDASAGVEDTEAVTSMHVLLAPLMIRRLKQDVNTGIPPKKEIYVACQMSKRQRDWYTTVLAKDAELLNRASGGTTSRLNNILMQLRKVLDHPYMMVGGEDGPPFKTDEGIVKHSGKMVVLQKLLKRLKEDVEGKHKVLIFSQFTSMLDILEDFCTWSGYKTCRIDGSTSGLSRDTQMAQFNSPSSDSFIFLLSTRSGGLGINLQAANHVILYDSDWNPQMDLQAQDRAHRIGQKRTVRIYRFIVDGTIEERMYRRALKKLYLDAMVVQQGRVQSKAKNQATADELLSMIRFGAEEIFQTRGRDLTEADIDQLLADGEDMANALTKEIKQSTQMSLASFKLGADEANIYEFEGVQYGGVNKEESKMLFLKLPHTMSQDEVSAVCHIYGEVTRVVLHPVKLDEALVHFRTILGAVDAKKALAQQGYTCEFASKESINIVSREMIDECFNSAGEKLGRGQRVREVVRFYTDEDVEKLVKKRDKAPPLKLPKPPQYPYWQMYNTARLLELHNTEVSLMVRNWRLKHDRDEPAAQQQQSPTTAQAEGTLDAAATAAEANGVSPVHPPATAVFEELQLSAAEQEERERLLAEGFSSWSHTEFVSIRGALTRDGVHPKDFHELAKYAVQKSEGEVRDYVNALIERGPTCIPHFDRIEQRIKLSEERRMAAAKEADAIKWKIEQVPEHPEENLKFPIKSHDPVMDRKMFLMAYDSGMFGNASAAASADSSAKFGQRVKELPELRFDVFYQSRDDLFFTSRLKQLVSAVKREREKPLGDEGAAGEGGGVQTRRRKKQLLEGGGDSPVSKGAPEAE